MGRLNTVDKVGRVLDLFAPHAPEWGVSEVAARLGIPRSSAHALLASLADIGLLQWREGGRYRIGWRVIELAEVSRGTTDVSAAAEAVLQRLVRQYGETCHIAVRDRHAVLYLDKALGTHNITVQGARIGTRLESHCTAVGKTLMAFADDEIVDGFLASSSFRRYTPNTITDPETFRTALTEIRRTGVGLDLGEAVEDVYCAAAPIRDEFGQVVAALSMSSPISRFTKNREAYVAAVKAAAQEVSRNLVDSAAAGTGHDRDYPVVVTLD